MADKAISQLAVAENLTPGDVMPIVTAGETKKVNLQTLFASAPLLTVSGLVKLAGPTETKLSGSLAIDRIVSYVSNPTVGVTTMPLPDAAENSLKIIISVDLSGPVHVTSSKGNGWSSLVFSSNGSAGVLLFQNDKWHVLCKT